MTLSDSEIVSIYNSHKKHLRAVGDTLGFFYFAFCSEVKWYKLFFVMDGGVEAAKCSRANMIILWWLRTVRTRLRPSVQSSFREWWVVFRTFDSEGLRIKERGNPAAREYHLHFLENLKLWKERHLPMCKVTVGLGGKQRFGGVILSVWRLDLLSPTVV